MKKCMIITCLLFCVLSIGTAFAAESPFADVPVNHWAYDAVKQLSKTGIVEGYKDGTFRGQNTITRFEMAIIAANAMTKIDKADDEQKELIKKFVAEFEPELKTLNIRANPPENKAELKIGGEVRERYEWTKDGHSKAYTRLRVNLFAPLTNQLAFVGRIESENTAGTSSDINVTKAFVGGKALGFDTFLLGRIPLYLGQGLLADSEGVGSTVAGADGIILGGGSKLKYVVAAGKAGVSDDDLIPDVMPGTLNLYAANLMYPVGKQLAWTATYLKDKDSLLYKSYSTGFSYKTGADVTLTGEYGENSSSFAKQANHNDNAKAWFAKVKYLGANGSEKNSYGAWVSYRQIDSNFDLWTLGSVNGSDTTHLLKAAGGVNGVNAMSNVKGFEYGFEQTLFKDAILSLQYNDFKSKTDGKDAQNFLATLNYMF